MNKLRNHAPFGNSPTRLKDVKPSACASCYGTGTDVTGKQCSCCSLYIESDNMGTQVINEQSYVTRITSLESQLASALAANQVMREALQFYADGGHWDYNDRLTNEVYLNDKGERATEALAIKLGDVTLVEVGYASEPSIQNLINGNDVIVGKKNDIRNEAVYALQKKG